MIAVRLEFTRRPARVRIGATKVHTQKICKAAEVPLVMSGERKEEDEKGVELA